MGNRGYTVPEFLCDDPRSSELPMTNPRDRNGNPLNITGKSVQQQYATMQAGASCDRPNRLNEGPNPGLRDRVKAPSDPSSDNQVELSRAYSG